MHKSLQHLARIRLPLARVPPKHCSACLETSLVARGFATGAPTPRYKKTITRTTNSDLLRCHGAPTARFSTSAARHAIKTMTLDDLDTVDSTADKWSKTTQATKTQDTKPSRPRRSNSPAVAANNKTVTTSLDTIDPQFYDPTLPAAQGIIDFRNLYFSKLEFSNLPEDNEQIQAAYRSLVEQPDLFEQLQPVDFMLAMNSCRDLLHVVPRMQRILQDLSRTRYKYVIECYHILLKTYVKMSDFKSCSNLVDKLRAQPEFKFNTATYHILLNLSKHERKMWDAKGLLEQMRKKNVEVNSATYLVMLSICARCKNLRMAKEYFDEMPLMGLQTDITHYNALLNVYAHAGNQAGANQVYQQMMDDGIEPDQYTYTALIRAFKSRNMLSQAIDLIGSLERKGWKPNVKVMAALGNKQPTRIVEECIKNGVETSSEDYNALMIHAIRTNQFSEVPQLLDMMHEHGHRPDLYAFTAMIDADIKMGKYQEAKEIFKAMQDANIQPDVIAYSAMISGALSNEGIKESMEILKAMIADGLLPNLHTFNSLLSASVGEIGKDGFRLIRDTMVALKVRPDNRSFNALLSAYALEGEMEEMERTLHDMKRSNVAPDALTYSILISGHLQNGDLRFAMEWWYKMMDGGFVPATFVVNNLMAALHGSGQGQQVLMMWHEMDRLGLKKTEKSFEIALEACDKFGLDEARPKIEQELKTYLFYKSLPVYRRPS